MALPPRFETLLRLIGVDRRPTSHREAWLSGIGAVLGVLMIGVVSRSALGETGPLWIVPSLGATAVLLFAVPHSPLSQPYNVVVGHAVSAAIGVTVARQLPTTPVVFTTALAVGLSITTMYFLRAVHPPGGATAMIAVLGGDAVHALGYGFVLMPIGSCVAAMLLSAVVFNAWPAHRRYPIGLAPKPAPSPRTLTHDDLVYALERMDGFVDVDEDDLVRIYELATGHHADAELRDRLLRPRSERPTA